MEAQLSNLNRQTFVLMRELMKSMRLFHEGAVLCEGLTFTQFVILDHIAEHQRLALFHLHELLAVEKSTTTRLLDPLVKRKLILKSKSVEDRRAFDLALTAEGQRVWQSTWQCFNDSVVQLIQTIPDRDRPVVLQGLTGFVAALKRCCDPDACCS